MNAPERVWLSEARASRMTISLMGAAVVSLPPENPGEIGYGVPQIEYVRADLHRAAVDELRRLLDVVGDVDRAVIEGALIDAGEEV